MKTSAAFGAGLVVLLAGLVLRNAASDSARSSNDIPPSIEPERSAKTLRPRGMNLRAVVPTPPSPPFRADLLGAIEAETDPDRRGDALDHAVDSVSNWDLPGLLDILVRVESSAAADLRQRLIRRWAETDGPGAAAWAAQLGQESTFRETLIQVAHGWADADLGAALDWADTLPAVEREAVTLGLGYETARTDAIKALEVAASIEPTAQRDDLLEHAISQWATTDFAAAVQWADGNVSDPDLRERLLASVAVSLAGQDGTSAARLAAAALTPGEEQNRVVVAVVQRWVQNEPELAASWVAQFPDTPIRDAAAQNLLQFWAAQDTEAAGTWLHSLPEGSLRTVGMAAYAQVQTSTTEFAAPE